MRKLLPLLKPYRVAITVALLLMLVELMVELFQPLLMGKMIDEGILAEDLAVVLHWGGILIGCSLLAFLSGVTNSFYAAHVSQSFGHDARDSMFQRTLSASYDQFSRFAASSLLTRLSNDVLQLQNVLFMVLRIMMRAPLFVIGGMLMSFMVNAKLALVFAVAIPLLITVLLVIMQRAARLFSTVQTKLDRVNGVMQENLAGMRLIKAFLRRKHEVKRFKTANDDLVARTMEALRMTESAMPIILLVMNISIVAILALGNVQLQAQAATVGEIVAIINYSLRITMSMSMVSMIIMILSRARASAVRVSEVLRMEEGAAAADDRSDRGNYRKDDEDPTRPPITGNIVFQSVSFRYPGTEATVLHDVSFAVRAGETIAVLGATGSGKSSLFQLVPRLYEPDVGKVYIEGVESDRLDIDHLRRHIGYVPQEVLLFSGTIKENIAWGNEDATMEQMIEAARDAQIHDTIMRLPHGYDTVLGQKGVNLSGGQKQRLSIARALVRKPKILLLDDCTSALDAATEARLLRALKRYRCTLLMITQKMSATMSADRILMMDFGRLTDAGTHDELLARSELYRQIYRSQYESEGRHHA